MFKILAFLKRKPGLSREAFRRYYEAEHAPLIAEVAPPMRLYRRNFLQFGDDANLRADALDFDVVTEMEFADRAAFETWMAAMRADDAAGRVADDELKFIDRGSIRACVVEQEGQSSSDSGRAS